MSERIEFRRKHRLASARAVSAITIGFVALVGLSVFALSNMKGGASPPTGTEAVAVAAQTFDGSISRSRQNAIVTSANEVGPAVVSVGVVATRIVRGRNPLYDEFFDSFFRDFLPPTYYKYRESIPNIGSGVIVSPDGYIVTNEHVVHGAEEITVVTPDGLKLSGEVAGAHEASDIAIIKVDADNLPHAQLGDSDNLVVGEWAIAIGNPFGNLIEDAHPSVTVGVISARKRSFKPGGGGRIYNDMIQTDAAINPGNSGGALVNADGEVVGINTFIFTRTGGSIGIGFAIPIKRVKKIMEEVKRYGKVRDVWWGFTVITVEDEPAHALGLPVGGVVVRSIELKSPADDAGLKPGDVIARVNGRILNDSDDAMSAFGSGLVGETFSIDVLRKKEKLQLMLVAREAP